MNLEYLTQLYNLIPLLLTGVVVVLVIATNQLRRKTLQQYQRINQLNEEINALLSCSRGISEKLHAYQRQFRNITERQDKLEVGEPGGVGYKQAIALFNRGASEDEMLTTCDLSRGEINLITHLEKAKSKHNAQMI